MIQEAIESLFGKAAEAATAKFERDTKLEVVELKGLPYLVHGVKSEAMRAPDYPRLNVTTLAGIIDMVKQKLVADPHCIVIGSATGVTVYGAVQGPWLQRQVLAQAVVDPSDGKFAYGSFLPADEFVIQLQTKFHPTDDRAKLMRILGCLSSGITRTSTDDGITQTVQVRAGVALLGEEKIQNPVCLKPYRTFPDVDQPTSPFVVRVKQDKDSAPQVALFEADAGLWKRAAMDAIHSHLTAAALGVPVLR